MYVKAMVIVNLIANETYFVIAVNVATCKLI